jgi:hypothetical protein
MLLYNSRVGLLFERFKHDYRLLDLATHLEVIMPKPFRFKAIKDSESIFKQRISTPDSRSHKQSTHKSERQVLMQYMKAAHRWSIS